MDRGVSPVRLTGRTLPAVQIPARLRCGASPAARLPAFPRLIICSSRWSSATSSQMRLCWPSFSGRHRMPSTLNARRANSPQTCDMTPGWLRTASSRITGFILWLQHGLFSNHVDVGGARRHHREHFSLMSISAWIRQGPGRWIASASAACGSSAAFKSQVSSPNPAAIFRKSVRFG